MIQSSRNSGRGRIGTRLRIGQGRDPGMARNKRQSVVFQLRSLTGGVGIVVARLAKEFERLGVDVAVVCEKPLHRAVTSFPDTIDVESTGSIMKASGFLRMLAFLARRRPDHVITNDRRSNVAAIRAKRVLRLRGAVSNVLHDTYSVALQFKSEEDQRAQIRHYREIYPRNHRIFAVSRGVATAFAELSGLPPDRIDVTYNPMPALAQLRAQSEAPLHRWLEGPRRVPVIVSAGRLQHDQKNFAMLIRAFHRLRQQRAARLVIIGEGKDRARLEQLVTELGIAGDVDLPGWQQNPYPFYRNCDVFAHCSIHEGFGLAIAEALSLGARVVAMDCPHGPREILRDGEFGLLVPYKDEVAMAAALDRALQAPAPEAPSLAKHIARFDAESVARRYLDLLGIKF